MCKLGPDIWIHQNGHIYDNISIYVNELKIVARDPKSIMDELENNHKFKFKGTGPISFHLEYDFFSGSNGVYALPHTNILARWSRPMLICFVKIQN